MVCVRLALFYQSFSSNSVDFAGGGMSNIDNSLLLTKTTFTGNTAQYAGGGMLNVSGSITLTNAIFSGNSAGEYGGGDDDYGDLHLQSGSPAINTGTNLGCPATDLDGNPRPMGPFCDIGAYEYIYTVHLFYLPFVLKFP